jgi:hypothetical protein
MDTPSVNITKVDITFDNGSVLNLVCQERFLRMRDAARVHSDANNALVEQAKVLEETIKELQAKCKALDEENQQYINNQFPHSYIIPQDFDNPLP